MNSLSMHERARQKADIRGRWLRSAPALVLVTLGAVAPLLVVFVYSFLSAGDYGDVKFELSGQGWFNVLFEVDFLDGAVSFAQTNLDVLVRSIKLALLTTLICAVVGFPTAFFIATRKRQVRSVWLFLITIPFWTNMLIRTFAIQDLLRTEGIVNSQLLRFGIIDKPIQFLYTDTAVLLGMLYIFLPLMVLPLYSSLEKFDFRLVEAAYDLYASRWAMLTKVIMPLAAPGLLAGSVLVFIPAVSNYIVPQLMGGGKNMMIGNLIDLQFGQGRNWPLGSALAVTLVVIVSVVLVVVMRRAKGAEVSHG